VPARKLPDFDARGGDGVEAAGGEALVPLEEAIDGVVLFDVGCLYVEEHHRTAEALALIERSLGEIGVGGHDLELGLAGGFEDFGGRGLG